MKLNEINNIGIAKSRKRVGRGIGSGMGKTSTRGHKGQKSRAGSSIKGFEGGQTPIYRRLPKRGFCNIFKKKYKVINLFLLQNYIDSGKLDASKPIDKEVLFSCGVIKNSKVLVKILGKGELKSPIEIKVDSFSKLVEESIKKSGGKIIRLSESS